MNTWSQYSRITNSFHTYVKAQFGTVCYKIQKVPYSIKSMLRETNYVCIIGISITRYRCYMVDQISKLVLFTALITRLITSVKVIFKNVYFLNRTPCMFLDQSMYFQWLDTKGQMRKITQILQNIVSNSFMIQ